MQRLPQRMCVPSGARRRRERDPQGPQPCRCGRADNRVLPHLTGEIVRPGQCAGAVFCFEYLHCHASCHDTIMVTENVSGLTVFFARDLLFMTNINPTPRKYPKISSSPSADPCVIPDSATNIAGRHRAYTKPTRIP